MDMKVDYLDHLGSDITVVNAARVSFAKHHDTLTTGDERLIKYLAEHNHISPFFHPQIQLRITVPIFVANQLKRHQVGFAINEESRRYINTPPEFYITDKLGAKAENKKQGSKEGEFISVLSEGDWWEGEVQDCLEDAYSRANSTYNYLLSCGVAPEDARMVLPMATYTSWIWTGSLYAYARMYNLRIKEDTQRQTREIAKMIGDIIAPLYEYSWAALTNKEQ